MRTSESAFLPPAGWQLGSQRLSLHVTRTVAGRKLNKRTKQQRLVIVATNARGFGGFLTNNFTSFNPRDSLPNPDTPCACGSDRPYGKCCRRFHTAQSTPPQADDLLRSRYSAYAYRLPSYIMKTTHSSLAELDRRVWKRDILEFCRDYKFIGGVDIMERQMTGPYTTRILFR